MQRRTVLRGLAALAAGASAGCTGASGEVPVTAPDPPPGVKTASSEVSDGVDGGDGGGDGFGDGPGETPDRQRFVVPTRTFQQADDGHLLVVVTVTNRTEIAHEAVMTVVIDAGAKTFTPSRFVSLGPEESREFRIHVPVPFDAFNQDPGFDAVFEPGVPETPIPDGTVTPYPEDRETATAGATGTPTDSATATAERDGTATE